MRYCRVTQFSLYFLFQQVWYFCVSVTIDVRMKIGIPIRILVLQPTNHELVWEKLSILQKVSQVLQQCRSFVQNLSTYEVFDDIHSQIQSVKMISTKSSYRRSYRVSPIVCNSCRVLPNVNSSCCVFPNVQSRCHVFSKVREWDDGDEGDGDTFGADEVGVLWITQWHS